MTERLTETYPCNKCNVEFCSRQCYSMTRWAESAKEKLAEYETAEEEGRLVVLPCKVGDTVWMVHQELTDSVHFAISKMSVVELRGNRMNPIWFVIDGEYGKTSFSSSGIGKTIFFSREEAEKSLKEMEEKMHE